MQDVSLCLRLFKVKHEVGEEAEAGGFCAKDAFSQGYALKACVFGKLPFFFTDAAFRTDENGNFLCLWQHRQECV